MLSDPAAAAWSIAGQPSLDATAATGQCGRCGSEAPCISSTQVVSERFSGIDTWPYGFRRLCVPCAWAYSRVPTTAPLLLITTSTVTEYPTGPALAEVLAAGPLPGTAAAVMPTTRRRHLLPAAQWGHLTVDGISVRWDHPAAHRLTDLLWLRRDLDIRWKDLSQPAPPYAALAGQPAQLWDRIVTGWNQLQPWRTVQPLWTAARLMVYRVATDD